ncbi:MAG: hypothetical protein GX652_09725 [Burkholderiaceae bacterium]|nr:hypothetical protein [Burkholderiaceae bacterium]
MPALVQAQDLRYNRWTRLRGTIDGFPVEVGVGHWVAEGWMIEVERLDDRVLTPFANMVLVVLALIQEGREIQDIIAGLDWARFVPQPVDELQGYKGSA